MSRAWIQSYPGGCQVFPLDLKPESIRAKDIFWALSNKCRFTGHTKHFYSVAQHCVEGARLLPLAWQLPFLLHEVSEAYLPDIAGPLKPFVFVQQPGGLVYSWTDLEAQHADVILPAIGCGSIRPVLDSPEVKAMDVAMLLAERGQLLGEPPEDWGIPGTPADVTLYQWDSETGFKAMCEAFTRLTGIKL